MNHSSITSYVLNDFLKFERKIYNLFGINIGRALSVKQLLYFIGAFIVLLFVPGIAFVIRVFLAVGVSWLLTDVGTENRPPIKFFTSFITYHWMKARKESYYKGRILVHQPPITFNRMAQVKQSHMQQQPPRNGKAIMFTKGASVYAGERSERTRTADPVSSDGKRPAISGLQPARVQRSG